MARYTNKLTLTLWVSVVYVLSFICYVPALLEQNGIIIPNILLYVKYLYVCIPSIAAIFLLLIWAVCMAAGIFCSYCYSLITGVNVNIYLSSASLLVNCIYLLITALVEEIAWRGFLLERSPFKKKIISVIFVGAVWAVWHIPMWIIRNSLSFGQIVWLCIWTVIVSVGLGMTYYQCRNILLTTIIHATFNICYLAPMQYNVAILAIVISAGTLLYKKSAKKFFD
ncbi:MAG: CPBP family intramembrane metalloprotease [Lachnospiraceae bacterium]|nr:CPBP family intramembrane metalloprotease [Lachnospiraceae bacterium]